MDQISELRKEIEQLRQQLKTRKRREENLDPKLLEAVISNIGTGFVVSDMKGHIIYQNDAALRIYDFRFEHEELSNHEEFRSHFTLEYPDGGIVPFERWPLTLALKGDYFREYVLRLINPKSRSRKVRFISYNTVPIYDRNGTKQNIVVTMTDLTDIREKTEQLTESRLRYQSLFNNTTLAMAHCRMITDEFGNPEDYEIIQINDAYTRISGLTKAEIEGKRATQVFPGIKNFKYDFLNQYSRVAFEGGEINEEIFDERFNKYISLYAYSPISGEFTSIFTDITPRKEIEDKLSGERELLRQALEALRHNEHRLRSIFGNAAIGILEVDSSDYIIAANERVCDILGYTNDELLGRTIHDITASEDRQLSIATNRKIRTGETGMIDYEKRYLKKDNTRLWVHVTISAVYDSSGEHIHSVATIEDITERKQSQEALKRSESILKQAGMMANLGAWEIEYNSIEDLINNPLHWSDQVYRIFGYEPGSVNPTNELFYERVHPDDREKVRNAVQTALQNKKPYTVEHRIVMENGEVRTVIENAEINTDESGRVMRMVGAVQDITERKIAEESLKKKNEELTRFIYTVSHDLKSPLVTIKSFSNYLQEDISNQDTEAQDRDLNFIRNAADKMARLLDELLELSRIGRKEKPKVIIPLEEVVNSATDLVAGRLEEKKIRVKITGIPVLLYGLAQRFIQLYQNLIDNAAKFMGDQPDPVIEVGAFAGENNEVVLFVRDNGQGIDPRYHHKIFGLFEKMDVETEGTGIGLALVKRIVEVHGGSVWFTSEGNGKGTTFYFTLEGTTKNK